MSEALQTCTSNIKISHGTHTLHKHCMNESWHTHISRCDVWAEKECLNIILLRTREILSSTLRSHTYTHIHTLTHTHTHIYTHAHNTHIHSLSHTHTHIHTRTHTHAHTHTYTQTDTPIGEASRHALFEQLLQHLRLRPTHCWCLCCVAVCCSVMQCVAVCCSVLQCVMPFLVPVLCCSAL